MRFPGRSGSCIGGSVRGWLLAGAAALALGTGVALAQGTTKRADSVSIPTCWAYDCIARDCCNYFNGSYYQFRTCETDRYTDGTDFYYTNTKECGTAFGDPCGPNTWHCPPP